MKKVILLILLLAAVASACQLQGGSKAEIANPASQYCIDQGGKLDIITAEDGSQSGVCTLKDGTKCDEWAYMRGECPLAPQGSEFCTEDAKVCDDGTTLSRDPENNCEFPACPNEGLGLITEEYRKYVSRDATQCAASTWICVEETQQFYDETGCGCEPIEPRKVVSDDPEQCNLVRFMCVKNHKPYFDESGCGCEWDWTQVPADEQPIEVGEGKKQAIDCTEPRPTACNKKYTPVCGQVQVQCIKEPCPPVMQTFGNECMACANSLTISYVEGECQPEAPERTYCTEEQKAAEICTMEYLPVCGSDGQTYGNKCSGCAADIDYYTQGECPALV